MKSKNIKVIDEHNIDRDANVMFAIELEGSEYVVYWISRDEKTNNVFVSKVLKNIDGTNSMLNLDDPDKKKEMTTIVSALITSSVSDQKDKMDGITVTLSNGKTVKFINVFFNKEQQINVTKTYIATVNKEVTKVAETYYDVVLEEAKVEPVLTAAPVVEPVPEVFPELGSVEVTPTPVVIEPITVAQPVTAVPPVVETSVITPIVPLTVPAAPVTDPASAVIQQPVVASTTSVVEQTPVVAEPVVAPITSVVEPAPVVIPQPVVTPTATVAEPAPAVIPQPVVAPTATVVAEPAPTENQPLVFNASKETNLNAALGEVANSAAITVENIDSVREFGVETPAAPQPVPTQTPIAPMVQNESADVPKILTKKAGFANSKFFMVVAISFFLASCIFLGYEVFNYFQLVK